MGFSRSPMKGEVRPLNSRRIKQNHHTSDQILCLSPSSFLFLSLSVLLALRIERQLSDKANPMSKEPPKKANDSVIQIHVYFYHMYVDVCIAISV